MATKNASPLADELKKAYKTSASLGANAKSTITKQTGLGANAKKTVSTPIAKKASSIVKSKTTQPIGVAAMRQKIPIKNSVQTAAPVAAKPKTTAAKPKTTVPYLTDAEIRKNYANQFDAYSAQKRLEAERAMQGTNSAYDANQRQNYINYMQTRREMPELLAQQGITGGMSETANLRARTNYENNLGNYERSRNAELASIQNNLSDNLNTYKMTADQNMNSEIASNRTLRSNYEQQQQQRKEERFANTISGYRTTAQIDNAIAAAKKSGETWKIPYLRNQKTTIIQQNKATKQAKQEQKEQRFANNISGYRTVAQCDKAIKAARKNGETWKIPYLRNQKSAILQQQKAEKSEKQSVREQRFANTISGYDNIDSINKLIKKIQKSGKDKWRIPYLRARRAELKAAQEDEDKKSSSSSGGSGSSGSGRSSGGGGGNSEQTTTETEETEETEEPKKVIAGIDFDAEAKKRRKKAEKELKKKVKKSGGVFNAGSAYAKAKKKSGNKSTGKTTKSRYKRSFSKNSKSGQRINQWVK